MMSVKPEIFKAYDIRGIYPAEISEENFSRIVQAIYVYFTQEINKKNIQVVLARDMRLSSPGLAQIAQDVIVANGATVVNIGLASTPTFYFACLRYGYDTGILISASHNPPEYNGIKFVKRVGERLVKIGKNTGMETVQQLALVNQLRSPEIKGKIIMKNDVLRDEVEFAFQVNRPKHIGKLKVVVDPANAMGILYLAHLFKSLPCELIKMNFTLDGTFPAHHPDPLKFETLESLQRRVIEEKADLGIATDGDGDRIFFVDEKGAVIPATAITSIIAKEILTKSPREKIIVDVRSTRNPRKIIERYGGIMLESVVGHALITEQLNRENAAFAGESSGHYYFREAGGCESSIRVILYLLEVLGREHRGISEIIQELTTSVESGELNFQLGGEVNKDKVFKYFAQNYQDAQVYHLDGITVEYPTWRFNIRASNTEPLIRLNLEGASRELVTEKLAEIKQRILNLGAKLV